jgi:biotin carboxyl carrier protein
MSTDQKPAAAPSAIKQVSAQEETVTVVTTTTAAAASTTTATATTTTTEQVTAPVTSVKSDVVVKEGETVEDDSHKVVISSQRA